LPIPSELPTVIHDRWIATLIAGAGKILAIPERLILYRQHHAQQIGVTRLNWRLRFLSRFSRANHIDAELRAMLAFEQRLSRMDVLARKQFLKSLSDRTAHLRARQAISQNPRKRISLIIREWRTGRYDWNPVPFLSALKDIVR
jgi:hypothetical protein